jgi:transcriptional regulator with XRE-family HTH domain
MLAVAKRRTEPTGFGAILKRLRENAGLTQGELGELCSMAYQAIARIERGAHEPTWRTVLKLAEALGVTPDAFVSDADE